MPTYFLNVTLVQEAVNGSTPIFPRLRTTPDSLGEELRRITGAASMSPEDILNPEIVAKIYRAVSNLSKKSPLRDLLLSKNQNYSGSEDQLAAIEISSSPVPSITFPSPAEVKEMVRPKSSFALYKASHPDEARAIDLARRQNRWGDSAGGIRYT